MQSVCYHDAHGFQVAGYVRCSRLIKRTSYEDVDVGPTSHTGPPSKKSKSDHGVTGSNQQHQSNSDNDSHNTVSRSNHNSDCGGDTSPENRRHNSKKHVEEEYVCVIRPADASFPDVRGNRLFSSLLSTASMVAHDLELRSSGYNNQADPLAGGWSKEDYLAEGRRGGHYSYDSSDQQQCSGSSNGTKNSTSSETTSEDNGESDDLDAPL